MVKTKNKKKETILILGSYGRGNLGDNAFLLAAIKLFPNFNIVINSSEDEPLSPGIRKKVDTIHTALHKNLPKKFLTLIKARYVVYCGGDLWIEMGKPFPRLPLYKMLVVNSIARALGKNVYYLGCGARELKGFSLILAKASARLANKVVLREKRSKEILALKKALVFPDITTVINWQSIDRNKKPKNIFVVGISILYFMPNYIETFPKLVNSLSKLVNSLPEDKYKVILFPLMISKQSAHDDLQAFQDLKGKLTNKDVEIFKARKVSEFVEGLASADLIIGTRLHSNILATLSGTPCLGISYSPKVKRFFEEVGLEKYCVEINELNKLPRIFQEMHKNYKTVKADFENARDRLLSQKFLYEEFIKNNFSHKSRKISKKLTGKNSLGLVLSIATKRK